ncbi:MAG TPA: acyl-CoA dehydrogenase family protein, partial [Candidatus Sulfotelmatobacter sp.]|nr:acyl-CoA dehydrogenase family protein [Candidatus Sulfotelmatobacter sp.]
PAVQIDQEQEIPRWVIDRLFELGVLGMTIPREYGGGGFGITSYNRVLERIGYTCGSTAVLASAHLSIGCKAIALFGSEEQKRRWLPQLATHWLSAFCLSEPDVGCDAGGQQTMCVPSEDGSYFLLNGEKKWSTSAALSQLFTVMTKQTVLDPKTGKNVEKVTALVCTPDMPGVEVFEKNRSKCGIRGTWQGRLRFTNVKVPRENLLVGEGKGLKVALTCLDFGRCTLASGMLGGARHACAQATKWAQTRYQFQRPIADFELVQAAVARMAALTYAMDAMLYLTTGLLDRHEEDIMVETAACKVFCSEMGWRCVNDAMQIMGGEGYMTENGIERILRDARIDPIVEGTNEVMRSFIFGYGGKQLAEQMLGIQQAFAWDKEVSAGDNLAHLFGAITDVQKLRSAVSVGTEVYLGRRGPLPRLTGVSEALQPEAKRLSRAVRQHRHLFKLAAKEYGEKIIACQAVQARLADSALWLYAWACTLSKLERDTQRGAKGPEQERDQAAAHYFMALAESKVNRSLDEVLENADDAMRAAAQAALRYIDTLPNSQFILPESSPVARGTGRVPAREGIKTFPGAPAGTRPEDYAVTTRQDHQEAA